MINDFRNAVRNLIEKLRKRGLPGQYILRKITKDDADGQRYGGGGGAPLGAGAKPSIGGNAGDYDGYNADSTTGGLGGTNQFGHAGNGGDIGYNGQAATGLASIGLAGYIYQGSVTINNLGGGISRGRSS